LQAFKLGVHRTARDLARSAQEIQEHAEDLASYAQSRVDEPRQRSARVSDSAETSDRRSPAAGETFGRAGRPT